MTFGPQGVLVRRRSIGQRRTASCRSSPVPVAGTTVGCGDAFIAWSLAALGDELEGDLRRGRRARQGGRRRRDGLAPAAARRGLRRRRRAAPCTGGDAARDRRPGDELSG